MVSSAESWIEQDALVDMQKKVATQEVSQENNLLWQHTPGPLSRRALKRRSRRDAVHSPRTKTRLNFFIALASIREAAEVWLTWTRGRCIQDYPQQSFFVCQTVGRTDLEPSPTSKPAPVAPVSNTVHLGQIAKE